MIDADLMKYLTQALIKYFASQKRKSWVFKKKAEKYFAGSPWLVNWRKILQKKLYLNNFIGTEKNNLHFNNMYNNSVFQT